jgi:hypothetical protein
MRPDSWREIKVYSVDVTTADAGLNNYVHALTKHSFASTNVHHIRN